MMARPWEEGKISLHNPKLLNMAFLIKKVARLWKHEMIWTIWTSWTKRKYGKALALQAIEQKVGDLYAWRSILVVKDQIGDLMTCNENYGYESRLGVDVPQVGKVYEGRAKSERKNR